MLKAVLFDLDDTLLDNDMDRFLPPYLALLAEFIQSEAGVDDPRRLVLTSTRAVFEKQQFTDTNRDVFWRSFEQLSGVAAAQLEPKLHEFYQRIFPKLEPFTGAVDGARELVDECRARGLTLVVATNPIFPRAAVLERMRWAGLSEADFAWITSYETSRATKPQTHYYQEILEAIDCEPERTLMVGNSYSADIAPALALGMHAYWVIDASKSRAREGVSPRSAEIPDPFAATTTDVGTLTPGTLRALLAQLRSGWPGTSEVS